MTPNCYRRQPSGRRRLDVPDRKLREAAAAALPFSRSSRCHPFVSKLTTSSRQPSIPVTPRRQWQASSPAAPSPPNLLATVAGNLFELKQVSGLRLLDLRLRDTFAERYPGPRFGVAGTRR